MLGTLALLIGFSFAMAVSRYDARRQLEVDEANDIGTTWLRTSTLSSFGQQQMRTLLQHYVDTRMEFASAHSAEDLSKITARTGELQAQMWAVAMSSANERRDGLSAFLPTSLNAAIDTSEKRLAAHENRIPFAA